MTEPKYMSLLEIVKALKYIITNEDIKIKIIQLRATDLINELNKRIKYLWKP